MSTGTILWLLVIGLFFSLSSIERIFSFSSVTSQTFLQVKRTLAVSIGVIGGLTVL